MQSTRAKGVRVAGATITLFLSATVATLAFFGDTAFATTAVNLSPGGPFTDGQTIAVSGTGFPMHSALPSGLEIIECSDPGGLVANLPTDASTGCDGTTVNGSQINTDATGAFSTSYSISALSATGNSNINCDATDYCVLWVGQDFNNSFLSGPHAFSAPFFISSTTKTAQTIMFSSEAPTAATVGGPGYAVSASASSGLPVMLSIDSSASKVCAISGSAVSFLATGTCTIDANQSGDTTYAPAMQVQQMFSVGAGSLTSTVTTTQVSASSITLGTSDSVSDNATVKGNATNASPMGTVNFDVCQTGTSQTVTGGPCVVTSSSHLSTAHLVAGMNDASSASSSSFTPTSAGTWCFSAVYISNSTYSSSADNTGNANLDGNECVLVKPASADTATFVSPVTVALGPSGTVNDSVTVMGDVAGGSPTGSVTFYVCKIAASQILTSGPCPASGSPEDVGQSLVGGAGDTSSATSVPFTPTSAGSWCFSAVYGGDANYQSSSDNTSANNLDPDECVLVTTAPSVTVSVVSSAHTTVGAAGDITDAVTVTGNSIGGAPTGSVDFYVCGPLVSPSVCASTSTSEGVPALVQNGGDTAAATSNSFRASTPGIYCFAAVYVPSLGANYTGSSDNNSSTIDANECSTVGPAAAFSFTNASSATAIAGQSFSFPVTTVGSPVPKIKKKGALPKALHLVDNHDGTATISGIPSVKKIGIYHLTLTATFGKGKTKHVTMQVFTLSVA